MMVRRIQCLGLALVLSLALAQAHARADRFVQTQRDRLAKARATLQVGISAQGANPAPALRRYTSAVDRVVRAVDRRVRRELGPPPKEPKTGKPVGYELFAMGSYARSELAPFSDLDYGILTTHGGRKVRSYFKAYGQRLDSLMTAIDGEARLKPCHGMSPSGTYGGVLVGTVRTMASCATGKSRSPLRYGVRGRDYIQSALGSTRRVLGHGGARLHTGYQRRLRAARGDPRTRASMVSRLTPSLRDPFGLPVAASDPVWSAGLATPPPKIPNEAIRAGKVNIKHDILRVFQMPINIFRQSHGIEATGTPAVIDKMVRMGHLDASFGQQLQQVFSTATCMRVARHLERGTTDDKLGKLSPGQQREIRQMVPVLRRLRRAAENLGAR